MTLDFETARTAYPAVDPDPTPFTAFEEHPIHEVLRICAELRPSVDIVVQ
jgi:ketol-acid reductoisomerase